MLEKGININQKDNLVFLSDRSRYIFGILSVFLNSFTKEYNLPAITVHGFRHTHASLLFESGATIKEVQDRLGHENVQTTLDIYTHITKTAREQTANKFANYINF